MRLTAEVAPATETSLALYFKNRLSEHARQLSPPPQEDTCWYLGNLLERFGRSEAFFTYDNGALNLRPLALLYGDALEAQDRRQRCLLLQQLGDMAMFIGAVFPQRYAAHGIQRDYFIGMGGGAYDYLADNARGNRHIFAELASMFARLLEMVGKACARTDNLSTEEVLALYQSWLQSRDPLLERQLRGLGIELGGSDIIQ